jgi:hypothetical protein
MLRHRIDAKSELNPGINGVTDYADTATKIP